MAHRARHGVTQYQHQFTNIHGDVSIRPTAIYFVDQVIEKNIVKNTL